MQAMKEKPRIDWIDASKGIGILLVLVAHVFNQCGTFSKASLLIYSFHMPLFFILSGYIISAKNLDMDWRALFFKYFKALLLPYLLYTCCNMCLWLVLNRDFSTTMLLACFKDLILFKGWKATWFLPALFVAQLECIFLNRCLKSTRVVLLTGITASLALIYIY